MCKLCNSSNNSYEVKPFTSSGIEVKKIINEYIGENSCYKCYHYTLKKYITSNGYHTIDNIIITKLKSAYIVGSNLYKSVSQKRSKDAYDSKNIKRTRSHKGIVTRLNTHTGHCSFSYTISNNSVRKTFSFSTLNEAIEFRENYLKQKGIKC